MNKKTFVTKDRIKDVAKFLKESIDWLKEEDCGCCHYDLDSKFSIYVGWQGGYDINDPDLIVSPTGQEVVHNQYNGDWTCGYVICGGVKIRNDYDCADYEFLDFPCYPDGEVVDFSEEAIQQDANLEKVARWYLESYVTMANAYARGEYDMN